MAVGMVRPEREPEVREPRAPARGAEKPGVQEPVPQAGGVRPLLSLSLSVSLS